MELDLRDASQHILTVFDEADDFRDIFTIAFGDQGDELIDFRSGKSGHGNFLGLCFIR